jgi:hypothetical protein
VTYTRATAVLGGDPIPLPLPPDIADLVERVERVCRFLEEQTPLIDLLAHLSYSSSPRVRHWAARLILGDED